MGRRITHTHDTHRDTMLILEDTYIWDEGTLNTIIRLFREEAYNKETKQIYDMFAEYLKECYIRDEKLNIQIKNKLDDIFYIETHVMPPKTNESFDSCLNFTFGRSDEEPITKKDEIVLQGYCNLHFKKMFPLSHRIMKLAQEI